MTRTKRITIQQVADEAGVSVQTVSRVLNNRSDVAIETRKRINEIMLELGYRPNAMARSLASQRTRTLGLITEDFTDFFFTQVIAGAVNEAREQGYLIMLGSTERNLQDEPEYIRLLSERHVEGFLFSRHSTESESMYIVDLIRKGVPVVTTAYHFLDHICTVVDVDNFSGGRLAAHYLIEGGHKQFAMICGPSRWKAVNDRSEGFNQELKSKGIIIGSEFVREGDWSYVSGYQAAKQLMMEGKTFSALFVHNDQMAIGAMRALSEAGLQVPEDVSVIGFDDIPAAAYSDPPLTTIRQPMREVGAVAARLLIQVIEGGESKECLDGEVLLQPELVRRASCMNHDI